MIAQTVTATLLVDADILLWRAATTATTLAAAEAGFHDRLAALRRAAGGGPALLALSEGPRFRAALWPGYKAARRRRAPPPVMAELRARLRARPDAAAEPGLEGDDVIGLLATGQAVVGHAPPAAALIASADKDLATVPGLHLGPCGRLRRVTRAQADRAHLALALSGDAADGFAGCPGVGRIGAARMLADLEGPALWRATLAAFRAAGRCEAEALLQARLARVLRAGEYDAAARRPRLWTP